MKLHRMFAMYSCSSSDVLTYSSFFSGVNHTQVKLIVQLHLGSLNDLLIGSCR